MLLRSLRRARGIVVPLALSVVVACQSTQDGVVVEPEPEGPVAHDLDELRAVLVDEIDPESLRALHDAVASKPHPAGTPGDEATIAWLADYFADLGLEVEVHWFWALLSFPESAELELVSPERIRLPLMEDALAEDPYSRLPGIDPGWNAYSASADVQAEVVYANYGTLEDFAELERLGVDCTGKIVLARYGGNFRGYKAKFAEEAGAAGLIVFTDPEDSGWGKGLSWPEGGFANGSSIQRGSILTLPWYGDPQTPGVEATEDAPRIDADELDLPRIPVQPVGWETAKAIMQHMAGPEAPDAWQGGLPFRYRLTGGAHLRARLAVKQSRRIARTANVVATLRGTEAPEQRVVYGCHHDAWTFGAADPCAGLICVLEAARAWSVASNRGYAPRRSISFACWGAEEYGIVGSVEWVESRREELRRSGVAYVNLDMAAMGTDLFGSSVPSLQRVIAEAASQADEAAARDGRSTARRSALEAWLERSPGPYDDGLPAFGDLGGGSDHAGFVAQAGMASAAIGAGGSRGVSYHSAYDDLAWYRRVVGDDYGSAALVTEVVLESSALLADAPVVPLDPGRYGREVRRHLEALTARGRELGLFVSGDAAGATTVDENLAPLARGFDAHGERMRRLEARLANAKDTLTDERRAEINELLVLWERAWLDDEGLPGRPWFENLYCASDETSGYAAWMLPALRWAVERGDAEALAHQVERYRAVLSRLEANADRLEHLLHG
ncbi:MAG: M28 family peptidase [Planctomycetota bacterium]